MWILDSPFSFSVLDCKEIVTQIHPSEGVYLLLNTTIWRMSVGISYRSFFESVLQGHHKSDENENKGRADKQPLDAGIELEEFWKELSEEMQ